MTGGLEEGAAPTGPGVARMSVSGSANGRSVAVGVGAVERETRPQKSSGKLNFLVDSEESGSYSWKVPLSANQRARGWQARLGSLKTR